MGYVEELRALVGHRPLILVGAIVIPLDKDGRILLQQRRHPYGHWGIPGGLMELGETVEETARRELLEEAGLTVTNPNLITIHSGPGSFTTAPNGDEFYTVTAAFYSTEVSGDLIIDESESLDFQWFSVDQLPSKIVGSHLYILHEFIDKHYSKLF